MNGERRRLLAAHDGYSSVDAKQSRTVSVEDASASLAGPFSSKTSHVTDDAGIDDKRLTAAIRSQSDGTSVSLHICMPLICQMSVLAATSHRSVSAQSPNGLLNRLIG